MLLKLLFLILCWPLFSLGQDGSIDFQFQITYRGQPVQLNKKIQSENDAVRFEEVKFYISDFKLFNKKHSKSHPIKENQLVDLSDYQSLTISGKQPKFKNIGYLQFRVGIDSTTHELGALSGDLDPIKGMYWTWQSGYINVKVEGQKLPVDQKPISFQYHLGGYQFPYATDRLVKLTLGKKNKIIELQLEKLLDAKELMKVENVMSTGQLAARLSDELTKGFTIKK